MNRRKLETLLLTLESTPALLTKAAGQISPADALRTPEAGGFSLVEHAWHLADLEREAYAARIRRLLTEDEPTLANFDGDRIARERDYRARSLEKALESFAGTRRRNVDRLRGLPAAAWKRAGHQESVGRVTLSDLPRMMAEHDREHTEEIKELLAYLRTGERPSRVPKSAVA